MDNDIIKRFVELRKKHGPTQAKFGKKLGLSDGTISTIESGLRPINEKHVKLICGTLGINETWLKEGIGPMSAEEVLGEKQLIQAFRDLSPEGRRLALKLIIDLLESEQEQQEAMTGGNETVLDKNEKRDAG
jgi:transcriptional regulator with XRE-family HTH domain